MIFCHLHKKSDRLNIIAPVLSIWSLLWVTGIYILNTGELFIATSFNRVFGNATLAGIDAQKRVNVMLFFNLIFLVLCLLVSYYIVRWFIRTADSDEEYKNGFTSALPLINSISICSIASLVILSVNNLMNQYPLILYAVKVLFFMLAVSLFYQRFRFITYEKFKWGLFTGFAVTLFVHFIIRNYILGIRIVSKLKFEIIYFIILFILYFVLSKFKKLNFERLKTAGIPLFYGTACMAVFLELTNILNQHGIFIVNRSRWAKIIYILLAIVSIFIYLLNFRRKRSWESICYLGLIIGIVSFTQLPPLTITATTELFEQANHGMLTYSFFNFGGSIPILESFDGHMLRHSFGGLIYGLLNGQGALGIDSSYFFYSFANLLNCITLFYLLKNIFSMEFSLLAVLFIPNYSDFFVLTIVLLIYCIKKDSFLGYLLYLFSIALVAFYELPPAIGAGIGSIITLLIILLPDVLRQKKLTISVRRFLKAVYVFVLFTLCVYFLLCLFRHINPISRLREVFGLINSNNNWAYSNIGSMRKIIFYICYFILPEIIVAAIICILYKFKANIKVNTAAIAAISLFFGHFANYSRMLGRHSLAENTIVYALNFAVLPLALLATIFVPKWKKWGFVCVFMGFPAIITFCINMNLSFSDSMMNYAMRTIENENIYYKGSTEKVKRVDYSYVLNTHSAVINMINTVVPSDETYIDLSSQTMLYALTGREKPVYINQSPLHLSGEYTQIAFINQINNYNGNCDFALLGDNWTMSLDGLKNEYRYYKVYEYLNAEFVPLCQSSDGYELWVRKTRYDEINGKLSGGILNNIPIINYSAELALLTDDNWTNGIMNSDPTVVLFKNSPSLLFAKSLRIENMRDVDIYKAEIKGIYQHIIFESIEAAQAVTEGSQITYTVPILRPYIKELGYNVSRHTYNLGYIPYLWGTFDSKKAYTNQVICGLAAEGDLPLDLQSTSNYIKLHLKSAIEENPVQLTFSASDGTPLVNYIFLAKSGEHIYLIRPSSDNLWGTGIISYYSIMIGDKINLSSAWLIVGD